MKQPLQVDAAVRRVEELIGEFAAENPRVRAKAEELARVLMELYGAGLKRILEVLKQGGRAGEEMLGRLAEYKLVGSLLLIHDLHPLDAEARIRRALAQIEKRAGAQISVEVVESVATVRVENAGENAARIGAVIEEAVRQAAPEVMHLEIEGIEPAAGPLVQIAPAQKG
jgi:hypothetical protein